jgi:hypothetical protein
MKFPIIGNTCSLVASIKRQTPMTINFTKRNKNNVNDAIEGKKSFKKLTTEEWHQFVQNYNYDDGNEPFEWLIKQKICDKGTALCLYWHLQPDFYCNENKANSDSENISDNDYNLIKEIEKRFLEGFYETELFSFNPKQEFLTSESNVSCIPKIMQEKTNGIPFERIDVEFAFLRNPDDKELKTIDKKIKDAISILQITNPDFQLTDVQKTITEIIKCVEHWKGKDLGKVKIENLSFLWLDCLREKYNWTWVIWDWETGKNIGMSNKSKALTCLANTIIKHTIDGFQPTTIISKLFYALNGIERAIELKQNPYSGIGLLFSSDHLKFQE